MKKGFTLLELIVVIVIIGILATLGFAQYTRMVERARGAEARTVLGSIRSQAAALWIALNDNDATTPEVPGGTFTFDAVGIGTNPSQISSECATDTPSTGYYFQYSITQNGANNGFLGRATRCTGVNGKQPGGRDALDLTLTTNFANGTDDWAGTGGY